jgi:glycerol-3-phosphate acyltransferase PlsY
VNPATAVALALVGGYLLGAVPVGLLVARLAGGPDLREVGSGRTGATNAFRALGLAGAVTVALLDLGKGIAAAVVGGVLGREAGLSADWVAAGAALAAVVGHTRSIFIGFHGGRGVATAAGGLLVLSPVAIPILGAAFALVVWRWRFVSLGSIVVAILAAPVTAVLVAFDLGSTAAVGYAAGIGLLVVAAHADNIARLRAGTERRLGVPRA